MSLCESRLVYDTFGEHDLLIQSPNFSCFNLVCMKMIHNVLLFCIFNDIEFFCSSTGITNG